MTENGCAALDARRFLNLLCKLSDVAKSLGNNDNEVVSSSFLSFTDLGDNCFGIVCFFGNDNRGCSNGKTALKSKISGTVSHNLNDTAAVVRAGGITELINKFHNRVHCGIKSDCVVG